MDALERRENKKKKRNGRKNNVVSLFTILQLSPAVDFPRQVTQVSQYYRVDTRNIITILQY